MEGSTLSAFKQLLLELSEFGNDQFSLDAVVKMHFQLGALLKLRKVSQSQERLLSGYFAQKGIKYTDSSEGLDSHIADPRGGRGSERDAWCSLVGGSSNADLLRLVPDGNEVDAGRGYGTLLERLAGNAPGARGVPPAPPASGAVPQSGVTFVAAGAQRGRSGNLDRVCGAPVADGKRVAVARVRSPIPRRCGPSVGLEREAGPTRGEKRTAGGRFVSPVPKREDDATEAGDRDGALKNVEPKMVELIKNEIMDHGPRVEWDDIAGLEFAKRSVKEMVVWPLLRPDIFTGLRRPARGLLLFGPPGTGKTLIGKCIASQAGATFFCISASSLTSKWVGEGEKMVRALFAVARSCQPSVVFIDEVDSLLSQRNDGEHESSRRIKTEFLVQLDGATTVSEDQVLVVGATNRPQELDEAARRRLAKRLYVPLPDAAARRHIAERLLGGVRHELSPRDLDVVAERTAGYSGADVAHLCREAALGPVRGLSVEALRCIAPDQVPPVNVRDFDRAMCQVRASVSAADLDTYVRWNSLYGSTASDGQ